jgi:hypothetical protein
VPHEALSRPIGGIAECSHADGVALDLLEQLEVYVYLALAHTAVFHAAHRFHRSGWAFEALNA